METNPRRRRFLVWFHDQMKGDRARLMRETQLTHGRISQLIDEKQPFGEAAGRNLAEKLGLPFDFFEKDAPGEHAQSADGAASWVLSETERDVLRALRAMTPEARLQMTAEIVARAELERYKREHAPQAAPHVEPEVDAQREHEELQDSAAAWERRQRAMGLLRDDPADDRQRQRHPQTPAAPKPSSPRRRAKS